jgi:spore maturation protein CgeB
VVLNDHWENMRTTGFLSNRLFDAVASGARVISDDVLGQEEVFGASVQVARTPDELRRLATGDLDARFGDDASRLAAARVVARDHSFAVRAETLLTEAVALQAPWRRTAAG